jgi:L,D-peptidoglycan transpeptidase YkuD (ErfK/YbiS/YcfS/YnhG family)
VNYKSGIFIIMLAAIGAIIYILYKPTENECQEFIANYDVQMFPENIEQLILVKPKRQFRAEIMSCQRTNGKWQQALPNFPAVIGENGVAKPGEKKEGDKKSPSGLFPLGEAFGSVPIALKMDFRFITKEDKYINDPQHKQYNTWVNGTTDAKSYEVMLIPEYKKGVVIQYNMNPAIPGAGSAIFMNIWDSSMMGTSGCVAMDESSLQTILNWLDKSRHPYIFVSPVNH